MVSRSEALDRIEKLYALASDSKYPGEAASAKAKAENLMKKYNIQSHEVNTNSYKNPDSGRRVNNHSQPGSNRESRRNPDSNPFGDFYTDPFGFGSGFHSYQAHDWSRSSSSSSSKSEPKSEPRSEPRGTAYDEQFWRDVSDMFDNAKSKTDSRTDSYQQSRQNTKSSSDVYERMLEFDKQHPPQINQFTRIKATVIRESPKAICFNIFLDKTMYPWTRLNERLYNSLTVSLWIPKSCIYDALSEPGIHMYYVKEFILKANFETSKRWLRENHFAFKNLAPENIHFYPAHPLAT